MQTAIFSLWRKVRKTRSKYNARVIRLGEVDHVWIPRVDKGVRANLKKLRLSSIGLVWTDNTAYQTNR